MNDLATFSGGGTLTIVRRLPGPIERVWAYLTDPKLLAKWLSDGVVADFAGGEYRLDMGASGRITAYEPPRLLEYTWNEPEHRDRMNGVTRGAIADALVRWELAEDGDGVRLTLTHSKLSEGELLPHGAGWHAFLERLSACVDGRAPESFDYLYTQLRVEYDKRDAHVS
jgi:uncharacterized protein YndB with AHSA1/START domain